jgi:hypothetical protein
MSGESSHAAEQGESFEVRRGQMAVAEFMEAIPAGAGGRGHCYLGGFASCSVFFLCGLRAFCIALTSATLAPLLPATRAAAAAAATTTSAINIVISTLVVVIIIIIIIIVIIIIIIIMLLYTTSRSFDSMGLVSVGVSI